MASQNDPHHQQPQTQAPHQDDGDNKPEDSQNSSTATKNSSGGEGSSQHNPDSISVDSTNTTGTDFFTLDGIQYNISK